MRIKELHLFTDDLAATGKFYKNLLELPVIDESKESISFYAGETKLIFKESVNQQPAYHFAFNIPSNQINEAYNWARQKLEILNVEPGQKIANFDSWHAKAFYFLDNNGNILELIARFDLQIESSLDFTGASFISISEVGIVGNEVSDTCKEIIERFGLAFFDKQTPLEKFAAIGDDNGLFIIVPQHRNWYPTNIASRKSWLKIVFDSGQELSMH